MSTFLLKDNIDRLRRFTSWETVQIGGIEYIVRHIDKTKEYYVYPWGSPQYHRFQTNQEVDIYLKERLAESLDHLIDRAEDGSYTAKKLTWTDVGLDGSMFCEQEYSCRIFKEEDNFLAWGNFSSDGIGFSQSCKTLQEAKEFTQQQLDVFLKQFKAP